MSAPGRRRPRASATVSLPLAAACLAGSLAAPLTGCGDPLIVQGDLPGIMRVVAGVPQGQDPASATPATSTPLTSPRGLAVDEAGVLYVADHRAARILAVRSSGSLEAIVEGDRCGADGCLGRPYGIAVDGSGDLWVADPVEAAVWRVELASGALVRVAGADLGDPAASGRLATEVTLGEPTGVAVLADGRVVFSDRERHRLWRIEPDGTLALVAGTGAAGGRGDGGAATEAELRAPGGLATAGEDVYFADTGNHRVRRVDGATGRIRAVAGTGAPAFSGDGGAADRATFRSPDAVAVTPDAVTLFVTDTGNHRVRGVNLRTGVVSTFAGTGSEQPTATGLPAGETSLSRPTGLAVGLGSFLFVADTGHDLVWRTPVRF